MPGFSPASGLRHFSACASRLSSCGGKLTALRAASPSSFILTAVFRKELMRLHRAGEIDDETLHAIERGLDVEEIGALDARV